MKQPHLASTPMTLQTPFTLNLLINLLGRCLLVGLRQITSTRRPWLSAPLSSVLKQINLSLPVTCQIPSLLKLHLERAGVSFCQHQIFTRRREVCGSLGGMFQHLLIHFRFIMGHWMSQKRWGLLPKNPNILCIIKRKTASLLLCWPPHTSTSSNYRCQCRTSCLSMW